MKSKDQQQDDRKLTRAIFEHATQVSKMDQIDDLVQLNADFARDLVGAGRCSLWIADVPKQQLWTRVADGIESLRIPISQGLVGACVVHNEVVLVNDAERDARVLRSVDSETGYRTQQVLCVPLRVEGRVIGALQLLNKPTGFTPADADLVGLLAHFAASAIEGEWRRQEALSAKLMGHELGLARDVQERLLPHNPQQVLKLDCVGSCRSARIIGGDYYDLLSLEDGSFAFTLGDVSGKGIPAAVMMAGIQVLLRSVLPSHNGDLAGIFEEINRVLYASSTAERYSTLFCGIVSPDRRAMTWVNAAQVHPFLFHQDGLLERLDSGGLPIALLPGSTYQEVVSPLLPGDLLVVVSDGLLEVASATGEFWEEEVVEQIIRQKLKAPLKQIPEALWDAADRWATGTEQFDDMTVVVLRIE